MSEAKMPELPEPVIKERWMTNPPKFMQGYYSADQMRAFYLQGRREALEEAAKACEQAGAGYDNEWNRKLGAAADLKDVADECAAAIRELSKEKE